ncbi:MAG: BCCT family transporter [Bdellovibrionaceae bacterium]|nr:BCCT family transporter [Pseudobdellovibrionaceae bacterium]
MKNSNINKSVFYGSFFFILLLTVVASIWPTIIGGFFKSIQAWLVVKTAWVYILTVGTVLFSSFWLIVSRMGDIKLGPDHSEPEFKNHSWFAMLFSAGMGIGLMFWGVAEPLMHFASPPVGTGGTVESAREAMKITFFHWGLHAWAIYAILAVMLAYSCYRKDLPLLPRSLLYPLLGDKIHGRAGDVIDVFAIIGTMFGVAASLGLGVIQVNAGLNFLFGVEQSTLIQVFLILGITALATTSVVLGLDGGIKKLSNINVILAAILMFAVLLLGNTVDLLQAFVQNTGAYFSDVVYKTFNLYAYEKKEAWIGGWTLLYWAWWISWAPFVGMFIARISKGRTIREFMIGVLFLPTGFTFLWMTVFGNSGINLILKQNATELSAAVNADVSTALFKFFEYLPMSNALSILGLTLVVTFFVSSSDSGSLVIDTLASGGQQDPPLWQRIFWAVTEGVVAAVLLLAGGLDALQTMTIVTSIPIIILIAAGLYGFIKTLRTDYQLMHAVQNHNTVVQYSQASSDWKDRLEMLTSHPAQKDAKRFLKEVVRPALNEVRDEMIDRDLDVELTEKADKSVALNIKNGEVEDFLYNIRLRTFEVPEYAQDDKNTYVRAEVFLSSGGQDYDVYGYSKEQIVVDLITQYEKHFHFLHVKNAEVQQS